MSKIRRNESTAEGARFWKSVTEAAALSTGLACLETGWHQRFHDQNAGCQGISNGVEEVAGSILIGQVMPSSPS